MSPRNEIRLATRARHNREVKKKGVARADIARKYLEQLRRELEALYRDYPNRANGARVWTENSYPMVSPRSDGVATVIAICEWFDAVRDYQSSLDAEQEYSVAEAAYWRKRQGKVKGQFNAALRAAENLQAAGRIQSEELDTFRALIDRFKQRLPAPPQAERKDARGVTLERQLGETLMSFLMAAGFRPGAGQRFTIGKAASLAASIAMGYGFNLSETSLRTWASQINKKKD